MKEHGIEHSIEHSGEILPLYEYTMPNLPYPGLNDIPQTPAAQLLLSRQVFAEVVEELGAKSNIQVVEEKIREVSKKYPAENAAALSELFWYLGTSLDRLTSALKDGDSQEAQKLHLKSASCFITSAAIRGFWTAGDSISAHRKLLDASKYDLTDRVPFPIFEAQEEQVDRSWTSGDYTFAVEALELDKI